MAGNAVAIGLRHVRNNSSASFFLQCSRGRLLTSPSFSIFGNASSGDVPGSHQVFAFFCSSCPRTLPRDYVVSPLTLMAENTEDRIAQIRGRVVALTERFDKVKVALEELKNGDENTKEAKKKVVTEIEELRMGFDKMRMKLGELCSQGYLSHLSRLGNVEEAWLEHLKYPFPESWQDRRKGVQWRCK